MAAEFTKYQARKLPSFKAEEELHICNAEEERKESLNICAIWLVALISPFAFCVL